MNAEENKSNHCEKLLAAVEKILISDGFHNLTIRKVCAEAGLSPGTFYRCYTGKTELLGAKLDNDNHILAKELENQIQDMNSLKRVFRFAGFYAEMNLRANPDFLLAMFSPGEKWHRKKQPLANLLEEIFENGQKIGEINGLMNAEKLAELFIDMLRGCVHSWCVQRRSFDLTTRIEKMTRVFMHSFILNV